MRNRTLISLMLLALPATPALAEDYPAAIEALVEQGVRIEARFDAPSGMTGYAARVQGRPLAFYVTADGEHVVVGSMLDAQGANLTPEHLEAHLPEPEYNDAWPRLEDAAWLREGAADAERVVYVFSDPNCPYCKAFWEASQAYIGPDVQVRSLPIAILHPSSMGKAARILAADDPTQAFIDHQESGSEPLARVPADIRRQVEANNQLMRELGAHATPAIFYKDTEGHVRQILGLPDDAVMETQVFQTAPAR
ncbi:thiol:disulfide interchange protein DsbG [Alkalilimnicola sp. S0819]|uniref:thiol:disulfide interchange protein DsbG n=1 Tax=Alkalilimnicola sp. S0819 TaxID=2613922 RepID=UPI001261BE29|nr:thiol:disulfide interchange protein DsbG [Alkalilimnicola sp. S0819]KAB7623417.1 thiol:disulfide interchange protein DsbG [Alkalilimnicola sp. S0819]MPQ16963.1 thiol:disulfide interchange protein DsbG [Alkalilimnicola sp. S0819]